MSEQFENSIRKRLQEAEPPFDPAAWDQMKKRLDNSSGRRPAFWWWMGGLLLLLGVGGWWWFSQQQDKNRTDPDNRISVTDSTGVDKQLSTSGEGNKNTPLQTTGDRSTQNNIAPDANVPAGAGNTAGAVNQVNENASSTKAVNPLPGVNNPAKKNVAQQNTGVPNPRLNDQSNKNTAPATTGVLIPGVNNQTNKIASPANPAIPTQDVNKQADKKAPEANAGTPSVNNEPDKNASPANESNQPPAVNNQPGTAPATGSNATAAKKPRKRGFDAGITLGPDYNTTPTLKNGRLGFGGGLLIRYHINSNFYLSTGAAYTKKLYDARDEDYYSAYPTNYKKIAADCNVLDVPLNVHYTFLHRPKSSWSVMAGASSYFMLKEKYEYYTNSGGKYKREFNNKNQHYFSVLNVGVSYERETPGRINWALQPYVKLPLGGVGEGKVNLYSAGVSLQVTIGKK